MRLIRRSKHLCFVITLIEAGSPSALYSHSQAYSSSSITMNGQTHTEESVMKRTRKGSHTTRVEAHIVDGQGEKKAVDCRDGHCTQKSERIEKTPGGSLTALLEPSLPLTTS
jgi:hypothetical protein